MEEMTSMQATRKRRRGNRNKTTTNSDSDAVSAAGMMIMNLPRDIIYEILSRLPIESVIQCMRVCKLWSTFRYDSYFIDLHFTKSMMHHRPPTIVLTMTSSQDLPIYKMSSQLMVSSAEGEGGDWRKATHIPIRNLELVKGEVVDIVGSCNGFLCIAPRGGFNMYLGKFRICLYNPITGKNLKLPKSHLIKPPTNSRTTILNTCGFGFGSFSKIYKVIIVYESFLGADDGNYSEAVRHGEIITVGDSSWRKLDFPVLSYDQLLTDPVFLDGTLYRLIVIDDDYYNQYILGLDIDSEKFWTIDCCPLPTRTESIVRRYLVPLDGSLALIDYYAYTNLNPWLMDIWLLEGSKTKGFSFTLTTYDISELTRWGDHFTVIGKHGQDTFLINVLRTRNPTWKFSFILYSPMKKQQYFCVEGLNESEFLLKSWMVPSLKSLRL